MTSEVTMPQMGGPDVNSSDTTVNATTLVADFDWGAWRKELNMDSVYKAAVFIREYHAYILSGIGIPCNLLSFLVLMRIKPLTSAICIMLTLAVFDSLNLIVNVFYRLIKLTDIPLLTVGCCMIQTARYYLHYLPIWLVVLLTLERVVAVWFPMKATRVCTISNARRSIIILSILDALICIPYTFIFEERSLASSRYCFLKKQFEAFSALWDVIDGGIFVLLPLITLCLTNIAILVKLRTPSQITDLTIDSKRQNRSVTVMLLAVSITTIVCLGPNLTLLVIDGSKWRVSENVEPRTFANRYMALWVIMLLYTANSAVNFFLYVLSGTRFRTELYEMIASWFGKHHPTTRQF